MTENMQETSDESQEEAEQVTWTAYRTGDTVDYESEQKSAEFNPRKIICRAECDMDGNLLPNGGVQFFGQAQIGLGRGGKVMQWVPITFEIEDVDSFQEAFDVFEACAKKEGSRQLNDLRKQHEASQRQAQQAMVQEQMERARLGLEDGKDLTKGGPGAKILTMDDIKGK